MHELVDTFADEPQQIRSEMSASRQDGTYPRPQLCRPDWHSLDGTWAFSYDDSDIGEGEAWFHPRSFDRFTRQINVPFPPESEASGIGDQRRHPVVWYRREVTTAELPPGRRTAGSRVLLHFGAVDYRADVWVDGQHIGDHSGGQAPFTLDITHALDGQAESHAIVVRAEDDPGDLSQPRGKQTWQSHPHKVWYERTTGIWQTVWIEIVPEIHITELSWQADPDEGVSAFIETNRACTSDLLVAIDLEIDGRSLGHASTAMSGRRLHLQVPVRELGSTIDREDLLWSPDHPVLIDAKVSLVSSATQTEVDQVTSYFGIRKVGVGGGRFLLNDRPYFLRGVLNQGYRASTHIANRGTGELRAEIELAKAMGFNTMRIHQKAEDPRILYWADRLGLLIWAEIGAAYEFSATAVQQLTTEWITIVRRDRGHPSVVSWVPINESWGLPNLSRDAAQQHFAAGIANLTRGLDPTRPVMSNEGWEHVDSDILGLHDYTSDPGTLARRYSDGRLTAARLRQPGDAAEGRIMALTRSQVARFQAGKAPLMITEFGGLSLQSSPDAFAYTHLSSDTEYAALLRELFEALRSNPSVAGFCYTQLLDTAQETNGLANQRGESKLPLDTVRYIVTGEKPLS
jgi:beta-galactosidase/beta-glucuronidase